MLGGRIFVFIAYSARNMRNSRQIWFFPSLLPVFVGAPKLEYESSRHRQQQKKKSSHLFGTCRPNKGVAWKRSSLLQISHTKNDVNKMKHGTHSGRHTKNCPHNGFSTKIGSGFPGIELNYCTQISLRTYHKRNLFSCRFSSFFRRIVHKYSRKM